MKKISKYSSDTSFLILLIAVAVYKVTGISLFLYGAYFVCLLADIFVSRCSVKIEQRLMQYLLYALVPPDNYVIIVVSFVLMIMYLINGRKYKRDIQDRNISMALLVFTIIAILSGVVHFVPLINLSFIFIYGFTFIFYLLYFMDRTKNALFREKAEKHFTQVLFIEIVSTILNAPNIGGPLGDDWNYGSLTPGQQNVIMILFACGFLMYFFKSRSDKSNRNLLCAIVFLLISLTTFCNTNTFLLFLAFIFAYLSKGRPKNIAAIILLTTVGIIAFRYVLTSSVQDQMLMLLTDRQTRSWRLLKLIAYENTYITIPAASPLFALFGAGTGFYSSRAACTCTGIYIQGYESLFPVSMSGLTQKYIYPLLINTSGVTSSILGKPYSVFISIPGEIGIVGLVVFLYLLFVLIHRQNEGCKSLIWFFALMGLIENMLEFPKYLLPIVLCYFLIKDRKEESSESKGRPKGQVC